jgi:F0F1-type ATP synthase membrane subunit b/b'
MTLVEVVAFVKVVLLCAGSVGLNELFQRGKIPGAVATISAAILTVTAWFEAYGLIYHWSPTAARYFRYVFPAIVFGAAYASWRRRDVDAAALQLLQSARGRLMEQFDRPSGIKWLDQRPVLRKFTVVAAGISVAVAVVTGAWWALSKQSGEQGIALEEELGRRQRELAYFAPELGAQLADEAARQTDGIASIAVNRTRSDLGNAEQSAVDQLDTIAGLTFDQRQAVRKQLSDIVDQAADASAREVREAARRAAVERALRALKDAKQKIESEGFSAMDGARRQGVDSARQKLSEEDADEGSAKQLVDRISRNMERAGTAAMEEAARRRLNEARAEIETAARDAAAQAQRSAIESARQKLQLAVKAVPVRPRPPPATAAPPAAASPPPAATAPARQPPPANDAAELQRRRELDELQINLDKLGLTLRENAMMTGGTTLGGRELRFQVGSIYQCASRCTAGSLCTAFSYEKSAGNSGTHTCLLFGGRPEENGSKSWTSATRF